MSSGGTGPLGNQVAPPDPEGLFGEASEELGTLRRLWNKAQRLSCPCSAWLQQDKVVIPASPVSPWSEGTAKLKTMVNSFTGTHCPDPDPATLGTLPVTPVSPSVLHF